MAQGTATKLALAPPVPASPVCAEFVLSAKVELYACLQLLVERGRFLTGADWVALAMREGNRFVYRVATGQDAPEIGCEANIGPEEVGQSKPGPAAPSLIVPVVCDSTTEGYFQLVSNELEFGEYDLQAARRLSELAGTAIEHMRAAEHSEEVILSELKNQSKFEIPLSWHVPDGVEAKSVEKKPGSNRIVESNVRVCQSCGFPVSPGRNTCMDCEEHGGAARVVPALFSGEKSESWMSAHGYTIASLLITALAAAVILWLR